jgi:sugar phosphate isomerase/epimerase
MKSAVTIALVPEARRGPFVFHACPDLSAECEVTLDECCERAAELGFDAVEIFPPDAQTFPKQELRALLAAQRLGLAAVGTGAGWVKHGLCLCDADPEKRAAAIAFIADVIAVAGEFGAPAIIGSMQGRSSPTVPRDEALDHLAEALGTLGERAAGHGQVLLYEPLNRYETDLFNRQADAAAFLETRGLAHVRLLCDLFHMNVEEADIAATLHSVGRHVGHVHWADSNRRAMGLGHTSPEPIVQALREIGYTGYLSAEVFPLPSSDEAASASIESFRRSVMSGDRS